MVVNIVRDIVGTLRKTGTFVMTNGTPDIVLPCNYIINCDPCLKIDTLPDGTYTYTETKPFFYVGDVFEVARLLSTKDKQVQQKDRAKYPCVILQVPFTEKGDDYLEVDLKMIIATQNLTNQTFQYRFDTNFENILKPLADKLIKAFKSYDLVVGYGKPEITPLPRYSKIENDTWDAIQLKMKVKFNNKCKKTQLCQQLV